MLLIIKLIVCIKYILFLVLKLKSLKLFLLPAKVMKDMVKKMIVKSIVQNFKLNNSDTY